MDNRLWEYSNCFGGKIRGDGMTIVLERMGYKGKKNEKCKHCDGLINIRNPTGFCDHLYYPDNCVVCKIRCLKEKDNR